MEFPGVTFQSWSLRRQTQRPSIRLNMITMLDQLNQILLYLVFFLSIRSYICGDKILKKKNFEVASHLEELFALFHDCPFFPFFCI